MRIIGGTLSGRVIRAPRGAATRPTSERVREALFSILGPPPEGASALDLYAGSGALGLEALSRGIERVRFIEEDRRACTVLVENARALGLSERVEVLCARVERALHLPFPHAPCRFIFADPPYRAGLLPSLLGHLGLPGCLLIGPNSVVVVEHPARGRDRVELEDVYGDLCRIDRRCYGEAALSFYVPQGARP